MAAVKRLIHFVSSKEYMKDGIILAETLQKCNHFVEETYGKTDRVFLHEDGEFDNVRVGLELSISEAIEKSSIYYTTWMTKAMENATTKGFAVLYREKILPPLSLNKGQRSNYSAAVNIVSEEAR